jgi:hypothetical protein
MNVKAVLPTEISDAGMGMRVNDLLCGKRFAITGVKLALVTSHFTNLSAI